MKFTFFFSRPYPVIPKPQRSTLREGWGPPSPQPHTCPALAILTLYDHFLPSNTVL